MKLHRLGQSTLLHVLNGAAMGSLVMTTFVKLGPSAQGFLQSLADVACYTDVLDRGLWLRNAMQQHRFFASWALRFECPWRTSRRALI